MPNGFHGSDVDWERIEKPLRRLDPVIDAFALKNSLVPSSNSRNWPDRTFRWGRRPEKLIQVFLENEAALTYTLWISATDERSRAEYWQHETLAKAVSIEYLELQLAELLEAAYRKLTAWERQYPQGR